MQGDELVENGARASVERLAKRLGGILAKHVGRFMAVVQNGNTDAGSSLESATAGLKAKLQIDGPLLGIGRVGMVKDAESHLAEPFDTVV